MTSRAFTIDPESYSTRSCKRCAVAMQRGIDHLGRPSWQCPGCEVRQRA